MTRIVSTERILVTNDDGIHAPGLRYLKEMADVLSDDVWVIAPDSEQSGVGHALSLSEPLRVRKEGEKRYAIRGTPTDSVMLALNHIMKDQKPTLIMSGINRGANLAEDVTYSGTVAAAMEGTLAGVPSIALSQAYDRTAPHTDWSASRMYAGGTVSRIINEGWPLETLININFPACSADLVEGLRVTEQGRRDLSHLQVEKRRDMREIAYYWFSLSRETGDPGEDTDLRAIHDRHISVTPLHLDLTHYASRERMAKHLNTSFL